MTTKLQQIRGLKAKANSAEKRFIKAFDEFADNCKHRRHKQYGDMEWYDCKKKYLSLSCSRMGCPIINS